MGQAQVRAARRLFEMLAIAAVYFIVAKSSLAFASINPSASPIWPPTGLALAVVLLLGYPSLAAIFVGAFAANVLTGNAPVALAIALGNTMEAFVGAWIIGARGTETFESPSGVARFAIAVAAASAISATTGVTALEIAGAAAWREYASVWATWWMGDVAGGVTVCPAIVLWAATLRRFSPRLDYETLALHAFAGVVGAVALGPFSPSAAGANVLAFLAVLPLLWAALRRGPRDTSTVALILSGFAVWGATAGEGPFVQATLNESFLLLVAFVTSITLPSLALSAAVAAREDLLLRRDEDYRRLIDSVRDYAILMLDRNGNVTAWNSGAARLKGYSEDEILGQHFSRFYTEEDRSAGEPQRVLAVAAEVGKSEGEGWRVRGDGSRFWAEDVVSSVHDSRGELIGFSKVTRDATTRRAAEAALEETRRRLDQAQRLEVLGRLTGNVAHDFRNLLASVSSGLHLIARADDRSVLDKVMPEISHAVDRGFDLTSQLLNFARPAHPAPRAVDFRDLVRAMRGILERTLGPTVELRVNLQHGLWTISIDPTGMEMVILNLVINARDAMPDGGLVEIAARNVPGGGDGSDRVHISVRDTGHGMSPEILAKALEPFFTTKEVGRGTGLGLSQVQAFATEAGGSVELKSEFGKGTIVGITLPRA